MEKLVLYDPDFEKFCWDEYCKLKRGAEFLGITGVEDFDSFKDNNALHLIAIFETITTKKVVH